MQLSGTPEVVIVDEGAEQAKHARQQQQAKDSQPQMMPAKPMIAVRSLPRVMYKLLLNDAVATSPRSCAC